jgi:hypothetical protein
MVGFIGCAFLASSWQIHYGIVAIGWTRPRSRGPGGAGVRTPRGRPHGEPRGSRPSPVKGLNENDGASRYF